ncbi:MAG TPA: 2-amino-4-hydroxy-6-hydroxymethyldihydropteridine diphosphokinase [Firmicutes bacterium]|nr:2-amino-4-hydroxy-6-hydroxymethyldihydropteridine diphosphokinase [Bacillota bacterium]
MLSGKHAYIGLGSNLGSRLKNLRQSLTLLSKMKKIEIKAVSPIYETEPVGGPAQGYYLNACAFLLTDLPPGTLLQAMLEIEDRIGRLRTERWGPRTIDLDLLVYEGLITNTPLLTLPHPRLAGRCFVLIPLADIAPDLVIPGENKTVRRLLAECQSNEDVRYYLPADWPVNYSN